MNNSEEQLLTNIFGSVRVIKPEERQKYNLTEESVASVKKLMPETFDIESNIDVLPVVFNLAVVNQFNDNDDAIKTSVAMQLVNQFINKPINVEHVKNKIIGHIINASFSDKEPEFEYNEIESFKDRTDPFFITAAGIIYRHIFPEIASLIEESSDPKSEYYQSMSTSWEVGFRNFSLAIGEGKISDVKIVNQDDESYASMKSDLKAYGGSGFSKQGRVRRIIEGPVFGLGAGITNNPAAKVKGIQVIGNDEYEDEDEYDEYEEKDENKYKIKHNFSQEYEKPVKADKSFLKMDEQQFSQLIAKLEESKASSEMAMQIKKIFDEQVAWQSKAQASQEELSKALAELDAVKNEFKNTASELSVLKQDIEAKASAELFNARVKDVLSRFELTEAQQKIVIEEVKSLDSNEESFEKYNEKINIIFANQSKEALAKLEQSKKEEIEKAAAALLEASASSEGDDEEEVSEELEVENAEASNLPNNNGDSNDRKTLIDRIKEKGLLVH